MGGQKWPNAAKSHPNDSNSSFYFRCGDLKFAQSFTKCFGKFCENVCGQELSKIAQSGHLTKTKKVKIKRNNNRGCNILYNEKCNNNNNKSANSTFSAFDLRNKHYLITTNCVRTKQILRFKKSLASWQCLFK